MVVLRLVPDGSLGSYERDRLLHPTDNALPLFIDLYGAADPTVATAQESVHLLAWQACHDFFGWAPEADLERAAALLIAYLAVRKHPSASKARHAEALIEVVVRLAAPRFQRLRDQTAENALDQLPLLVELVRSLRHHLSSNDPVPADEQEISLILLGSLGCVPALDDFTLAGMRSEGMHRAGLSAHGLREIFSWARHNEEALARTQSQLVLAGAYYPQMKLVELHFRRIGTELLSGPKAVGGANARPA